LGKGFKFKDGLFRTECCPTRWSPWHCGPGLPVPCGACRTADDLAGQFRERMLAHVVNSNSSSRALSSSAADSGSLTAGPLTAVTLAPFARLPRHHPRARSPRRAAYPLIPSDRRRPVAWRPPVAGKPGACYRAPLGSGCADGNALPAQLAMRCQRNLAGCRWIGTIICRQAPASAAASATLA